MKVANVDNEYNKNPDMNREEVKKLMDWIKQQPHLPDITELEAILFLYSCHNSMELTKQTVDIYFTMRTHCPDFFSGLNFQREELKRAMKNLAIFPSKSVTPEGYRIFFGKLHEFDPGNFNFADSLQLYTMLFDLWLQEIGTAPGIVIIMDQTGVSLGHIARLGPFTMKKFLYYLQDAAPIRIAGFHFVNIVPHSDKIIALMRPFMKKELSDVLHIHPSLDTLAPFVPLELLPKDYGGSDESCDTIRQNAYKNAIANQDYFNLEEKRKVNEKARPGKPKDASAIFGAEGNFKKLDID